jgi:eukaryotic-like serine/threonine-protein kinase
MDGQPLGAGDWSVPGFAMIGELGSGAFGRVVLAVDANGRQVAIKYLAPQWVGDHVSVARFRAEARLLAQIDDPNVVRFYEYVEAGGAAAIVMEYVEGVSLGRMISEFGPTVPEAALLVLRGSLLGLAAAHRLGVVHRDYKPANILVQPDGTSRLTDFGVAVAGGASTGMGGTPAYMAPEQFLGMVGASADVYGATVVFFECLTGHRPYQADTGVALAAAHAGAPIPVEEVPEPLRPLIAHGMAKDPADRPMTADLFVTELEQVAGTRYGPDWADRGRIALAAAAGALIPAGALLLASGGVGAGGGSVSATAAGGTSFFSSTLGIGALSAAAIVVVAAGSYAAVRIVGSSTPKPKAAITAAPDVVTASIVASPAQVTSPDCAVNGHSTLTGTITVSGRAATVQYEWVTSNGTSTPGTATFDRPGSQTVTGSLDAGPGTYTGTLRILQPVQVSSDPATVVIECASASPHKATTPPVTTSLSISGSPVAQGGGYTINASGFQPNEKIVFSGDPDGDTTAIADSSGAASATVNVAGTAQTGTFTITGTGQNSGSTATGSVTIVPGTSTLHPALSASPGTVRTGDSITISATGFRPGETVGITFDTPDDHFSAQPTADSHGDVTVGSGTITTAAAGSYTIRAAGAASGATASTDFTVQAAQAACSPTISVSPQEVTQNAIFTISGSGFLPNTSIQMSFDPGQFNNVAPTSDSSGSFSVDVTDLAGPGTYTITASANGCAQTTTTLTVIPDVTPT